MAFTHLREQLAKRERDGYLRRRFCVDYEHDNIICVEGQHYINAASNDYLGMRQHQGLLQAWVEGLSQYGGGSGASPLVTGYSKAHQALEDYLADQLQREAVLLFQSGYAANMTLCQALFHSGGTVIADKLMHASFIEGAMASHAVLKRFQHNNTAHLEQLLEKCDTQDILIASEGIFSMDGDSAPVETLSAMAKAANAWLMLDDAHAIGVLGERGFGSVEHYGLTQQQCPVVMGTFGKAIGTGGAFIAGSQDLIDYLINFAKHYVYSTAMPPAQAVATRYAFQFLETSEKRHQLQRNIHLFRQHCKSRDIQLMDSQSAIQPVIVGSPARAIALANGLKKRGIWAVAMRYPTVAKGTDRVRFTLNALHTEKDIEVMADALKLALNEELQCK